MVVRPGTFPVETVPLDVVHARLRGSGFGAAMPPLKEVLQRGPAQRARRCPASLVFVFGPKVGRGADSGPRHAGMTRCVGGGSVLGSAWL